MIVSIVIAKIGFVLTMKQTAGEIHVSSNKPLIKIDDSTYQIPDSLRFQYRGGDTGG